MIDPEYDYDYDYEEETELCNGCGEEFYVDDLDEDGYCGDCS